MAYQMDLDVGMKCIKYMLFVANFMFVMIGFLLISIGTTIEAIYRDFEVFMESHFFSPAALCVAIGVIIFFVALFGCLGALKESTCLVNTFAYCLIVILILEISASIAAYAMRNDLKGYLRSNMNDSLDVYIISAEDKEGWDNMQKTLSCCGIESSQDFTRKNISIPDSCRSCDQENCTQEQPLYKSGCLDRLTYLVSECALLLGIGALCVSFIQILGIVFAKMLAKSIRKLKTERLVQREENRRRIYQQWTENNAQQEKASHSEA
ncbi:CD63 antigen-like [Aethina tumida]|uniref:CD63 antigen-like n=1 Tax=Aethina tumida TaxID=116153 RepID=UPI00096AE861|nr:CD63 antigen-like [Aethina tumida]